MRKVRIMGVINASPESFYKRSVKVSPRQIANAAARMQEDGADLIDIGAMSTAPYLRTMIPQEEEERRIRRAARIVRDACSLPISVDTPRAGTARAALDMGANIINDVTGLKYDPEMAGVVADNDVSVILCAYEKAAVSGSAVQTTINALKKSIRLALDAGIRPGRITIDPAIGFFREKGNNPFFTRMRDATWLERDLVIIKRLAELQKLGKPVCVSVSRKSFIGKLLGMEKPEERLLGSIAAEVACVLNGADIIRTHNVAETKQAVMIAEAVMKAR